MNLEATHESTLLERARIGDRAAFDALLRRFTPYVHGILVGYVVPADADDLMQDVFVAAWRSLAALSSDAAFGAWIGAIARNRARRFHARKKTHEALPADVVDPNSREATLDGAEILAILRTLPETYRETLCLRLIERMSGPEIATATGLTHGSVRVNLSRGMELLRETLRERGWP